ncbi:MAG: hypothetical protein AAF211_29105, partial [Myxococcota bacterium]
MVEMFALSLVHFVWQGLLVGLVAEVGLQLLGRASAEVRYGFALAMLTTMPLCFVATLLWLDATSTPLPTGLPPAVLPPSWTIAVVVGWGAGVTMAGLRAGASWLAIHQMRTASIAAPPALQRRFRELADRVRVTGVELRLVAREVVPMAVGVFKPAVLFPAALLAQLPQDEVES